ncbi:MAG: HNH endonuclease, partial [Romboutsia sp.]|nr:HNH endonuclease [Romboutsia sp.]
MKILQIITIPEELNHGKCKPIQGYVDNKGCFIINSHKLRDGDYPTIRRNRTQWIVHRYIFTKWREEIPKGMEVLHNCNNTKCANPDHLRLGTHKENMQDKVKAGTQPKGSVHPGAKLNEERV